MKNKIFLLIFILLLISIATSCKSPNKEINNEDNLNDLIHNEEEVENIYIIPFKERRFIYQNGLTIENKQETISESDKNIEKYYPQLNGIINKEVEKKINNDIVNLVNEQMFDVENSITSKVNDSNIQSISTHAYVDYNCNNVMFLEYSSYISYASGGFSESYYFTKSQGYDLNTGNKIGLKDLFKQGTNYKKILNDYIYMEIIKSNYDDPDSLFMKGPFQGIRDNQSFSFNDNRLLIIMDEKNEEFYTTGYPITITIPLKEIGDELAIFDRYFDEKNNIFENKRIKKLMPNIAYYHIKSGIMEYKERYSIHIEEGEFLGIDDIETKNMLNNLLFHNLDVEGFRERANKFIKAYPGKYYGGLYHHVAVIMNAGGYISINTYSDKNELNIPEANHKHINYDLNNKKFMTLKDLFIDSFDYKTKLVEILKTNQNYYLAKGTFSEDEEILMSENDFSFSQDAVFIIFYQPGESVRENHVWIEYKDIGYENISILQ